jgi:hypothetical protein
VNLEESHVRGGGRAVYTSDHVPDLVIAPDRTRVRQDEDELALAVTQGAFDGPKAAAIEENTGRCGGTRPPTGVRRSVAAGRPSRLDPAWPIPRLVE